VGHYFLSNPRTIKTAVPINKNTLVFFKRTKFQLFVIYTRMWSATQDSTMLHDQMAVYYEVKRM